jgi:cytochrome P450
MATTKAGAIKRPPKASHTLRDQARDPLGFFLRLTREHGDIVQYRTMPEPAYLINHPSYVQHVLLNNGRNYNKNTHLNKYMLGSLTGQGLLTSEGELWRRQRRLIQPAFHRRNLVKFEAVMHQAAARLLEKWSNIARRPQPVDVANEMMQLTLDIVTQSLFGYDITEQAETIGNSVDTLIKVARPRRQRFQAAKETLDNIVYGIINNRRQSPETDAEDLLAMMLLARDEETGEGMSDQQLRDEVMSLLIAGHETTANTLSWLWWLLSQHPEVRGRLELELARVLDGQIPTMTHFADLTYTKMVVEESMRLYPSAWTISRRAIADDTIGGYHIPAQAVVAMSPYTMHRHPRFWDDPERFDPERFTPEKSAERHRFAYFPFGGGARRCIGEHFAMMENMIIVPALVQHFRMHLVPDHPVEPHALITLRPRHGMLMKLEQRR